MTKLLFQSCHFNELNGHKHVLAAVVGCPVCDEMSSARFKIQTVGKLEDYSSIGGDRTHVFQTRANSNGEVALDSPPILATFSVTSLAVQSLSSSAQLYLISQLLRSSQSSVDLELNKSLREKKQEKRKLCDMYTDLAQVNKMFGGVNGFGFRPPPQYPGQAQYFANGSDKLPSALTFCGKITFKIFLYFEAIFCIYEFIWSKSTGNKCRRLHEYKEILGATGDLFLTLLSIFSFNMFNNLKSRT
jgi:hypothetical protein